MATSNRIEIMDTTLRDGEQTSGVSFTDSEKLTMAQLILEELKVDRLEVASARVSKGEFEGAKKIFEWAASNNCLEKIEVLGFVDGGISLEWIRDAGGKVINLLCKGSRKHCEKQLRKTQEEHLADITAVVSMAEEMGISVNVYLEDWSNGMRNSKDYVFAMTEGLSKQKVERIMLPDTLGILNHIESYEFCKEMVDAFPDVHFDFHAHNDYDLSTANVYESLRAGVSGIHTTLNGLGERAGNVPLSSVIGIAGDHLRIALNLDETKLYRVSKLVESFSGVRIPANKPLVGEFVFTQTSGIHADGDNKDNLYHNDLKPERFGRKHTYALGKMSGKANIKKNLEELGIELDAEATKKLTQRIIELGDKKEAVTKEDLPFIISDVLRSEGVVQNVIIENYSLSVAQGLKSVATLSISVNDKKFQETSNGDGQYDAFMNALNKVYQQLDISLPKLIDYSVSIPPGGKTDALVITTITWQKEDGSTFKTRGLDPDQTIAAINSTIKMLNIINS